MMTLPGGRPGGEPPVWQRLVVPAVFLYLLLSGSLGWLFDLLGFGILFVTLVPLLGFAAFNFYLSQNLLEGSCPTCSAQLQGLKNQDFQCQSCGTTLSGQVADGGVFRRKSGLEDDGVINVEDVGSSSAAPGFFDNLKEQAERAARSKSRPSKVEAVDVEVVDVEVVDVKNDNGN